MHEGSQSKQLVPERKLPSMHEEQVVGFRGSHLEQPAAQMKQLAELESKVCPAMQEVQLPVEQLLHPGLHTLTYPFSTNWVS